MQTFELLEHKFGEWIENDNTVAVSSGTSALHIACEVLAQLEYGKRSSSFMTMKIPEFTMIACPRAAAMARLTPWFEDCNDSLLMLPTPEEDNFVSVMAVHVYGRKMDLTSYLGVPVIEDLAEAHGINPRPESFAGCWSFYKNKQIHGEEGGMIAFKDKEAADLARKLRSLGFDSNHNYMHVPRGINARMSNLHAEPILRSLSMIDQVNEIRAAQSAKYDALLPEAWKMPPRDVHWVHDIRIPGLTYPVQDCIVRSCRNRGLEARHGFKPMSDQPEFSTWKPKLNARRLSQEVIYLPLGESLSLSDIAKNAETFVAVCRSFGIVPN